MGRAARGRAAWLVRWVAQDSATAVSGRCTPSDTTEKARIGRRSREWTAVGNTEVECVPECWRNLLRFRAEMPRLGGGYAGSRLREGDGLADQMRSRVDRNRAAGRCLPFPRAGERSWTQPAMPDAKRLYGQPYRL